MKPADFQLFFKKNAEDKKPVNVTIEIPGQGSMEAKLRYKGSTTIFYPKRPYKIKFSKKITFYNCNNGVRNIKLNPMFTDKSFIREKIIWDFFSNMEGFGPKECGYANLFINGEDKGIYILIQDLDEEFLDINNLSGNMYKSHEESSSEPGLSVRPVSSLKKLFKKESGDEKDYSDLQTLTEILKNTPEPDFANKMHEVFDMKSVYDWLVLNTVTQMGDSYNKNYYLFHDLSRTTQSWRVIPWDYDMSMGRDALEGVPYPDDHLNDGFAYSYEPLSGPKNVLKDRIIANPVLFGEYKEHLRKIIQDFFNEEKLFPKVDEAFNDVSSYVINEKKRWGTYNDFLNQKEAIKYFITARRNFLLNSFLENAGGENDMATVNVSQTDVPYNFVDASGKLVATMWFTKIGGLHSIDVRAFPSQDPASISSPHIKRYLEVTPHPSNSDFKAELRWGYYGLFDGTYDERTKDLTDERQLKTLNYSGGWQEIAGSVNPFANYADITEIYSSNCGSGKYFALAENNSQTSAWNKQKNLFWNRLHDVKFSDVNNGFICGDDGIVLSSRDGGNSWTKHFCGIYLTLNKISVISTNTIIAAGESGIIYKTANGGTTWESVNNNIPSNDINDIIFTSSQKCYCAGNDGMFLVSNNSGNSWQQKSIPGSGNLYFVLSSGSTLITGGSGGKIYKSDDEGNSWNQANSGTVQKLNCIVKKNENQFFAAGEKGTFLISNDNGTSWEQRNINTDSDILCMCLSGNTIYATGTNGQVFSSENGSDWIKDKTTGSNDIHSVIFVSGTGYAVGNSGTVLTTK